MPRRPVSTAYRSILVSLRDEMHSTEELLLMFNVARYDELSPSERVAFADLSNRYRELLQELCDLCRRQGL